VDNRIIECHHVSALLISQEERQRTPYWSIVENKRLHGGRVVQRHVLYLGEINSSQELAWRKSIEVLEGGRLRPKPIALFPEDPCAALLPDESIVRVRLSARLCRPRQWGACWCAASPSSARNLSEGLRQRLNALSSANDSLGKRQGNKAQEQSESAPPSSIESPVQEVVAI
jgi:hypothetical protein